MLCTRICCCQTSTKPWQMFLTHKRSFQDKLKEWKKYQNMHIHRMKESFDSLNAAQIHVVWYVSSRHLTVLFLRPTIKGSGFSKRTNQEPEIRWLSILQNPQLPTKSNLAPYVAPYVLSAKNELHISQTFFKIPYAYVIIPRISWWTRVLHW